MWPILPVVLLVVAWVGHACVWTAVLNHLYGRRLPKRLLKPWRALTGVAIVGFPALLWLADQPLQLDGIGPPETESGGGRLILAAYFTLSLVFGAIIFPGITAGRFRATKPACVVSEVTRTLDLWPELGEKLLGDGHLAAATRLPFNGAFRIDITDLTLSVRELPPEWDGLTLLVLSDLHFHGTPARPYFDRIVDELLAGPVPDLVCLVGDYVDTDAHRAWIGPILGRLTAKDAKFAVLGNHDLYHDPDRVREELTAAGYTVLGNTWQVATVRGVACVVVGHEGPWFAPGPDLSAAPPGLFRLCLSHTPDNIYWGVANRVGLMLSGHVHGGAIRVPVIGSIFVPSVYGRRFDQGVFEQGRTVLAVNRGVSGREPIRFRCNPQVMRLTLTRRA